ncbi:MAG: PilZ domain-containing protein [Vulcanimicrobiota bacterium]
MERREFPRVKLHHQAMVEGEGQRVSVVVSDINANGVCLHAEQPIPSQGTIKLVFPGIAAAREYEAVYARSSGGDHTIGARFRPWRDGSDPVEAILRYLNAQKTKEGFQGKPGFEPNAKPYFGDRSPS